jgi:hypothetical protein
MQNNNPNFKQLHINSRTAMALNSSNELLMKNKLVKKLSEKGELSIRSKKLPFYKNDWAHMTIGAAVATGGMTYLACIEGGFIQGILASAMGIMAAISGICTSICNEEDIDGFTVQWGEKLKNPNAEQPKLDGKVSKKYSFYNKLEMNDALKQIEQELESKGIKG